MPYLLKINQADKSYDMGIFCSEPSIFNFIESIPFVKKEIQMDYVNYYMNFEDLPDYYEINYHNFIYIQTDIFFTFLRSSQLLILFDTKTSYSPDKSF